jgi:callose synthase
MKLTDMRRPLLKLFVAVFWVVTLPVCYLHSSEISTRMVNVISSRLGQTGKVPYLYTAAVAVYMLPNVFGVLFFLAPFFKKQVENSSWWILQNLISWSEVSFFLILCNTYMISR